MGPFFLLGLLVGVAFGYWWVARRGRKPPYRLRMEYWVYLPGEILPPQDEYMGRLVDSGAIGSSHALLFSDVRLHVALVLRSKNAHVFRPDLLAPYVDATAAQLETLAASRSLAKVRYVSEEPVRDRRHLEFLPQLARIVAEMGGGTLVYDPVAERLLDAASMRGGAEEPNVRWVPAASGGHVETLGLRQVGVPEIETHPIAADERWIVTEVVRQAAHQAWTQGELPPSTLVEAFDDRFRVDSTLDKDGVARARLHRIQEV